MNQSRVLLILVTAAMLAACSTPETPGTTQRQTQRPTPEATPWAPAGYTVWAADPSIALRFQAASEFTCSFGRCKGMEFVTRDGCPNSLYVELSLLDASGASVGFTNDVAGVLSPGQHAKLLFDVVEDTATNVKVTEISCY